MLFSQLAFNVACPEHRFLEEMARCVPWNLFEQELNRGIHRKTGGRPPYALVLLFKMHLLQTWFSLSDAQCEFQCQDRLSFRKFLGLGLEDRVPEATTLENFRHDFAIIAETVFLKLDALFKTHGLFLKEGNIVDATLIRANSRPHNDATLNSDQDAEHGGKGFGFTTSINRDVGSKLIRRVHTDSARAHDIQHLSKVLSGEETLLYGDSGYQGCQKALEKQGCRARIMFKRERGKKGEPAKPLPLRLKYMNRLMVKTRVRVEHAFACFKTVFKLVRTAYRGLERVSQQMVTVALAYNLRRFGFLSRA